MAPALTDSDDTFYTKFFKCRKKIKDTAILLWVLLDMKKLYLVVVPLKFISKLGNIRLEKRKNKRSDGKCGN